MSCLQRAKIQNYEYFSIFVRTVAEYIMKYMNISRLFLFVVLALVSAACHSISGTSEYSSLTAQAEAEYVIPLRPGGVDGSPFWNIHATRFTYAPAFGFNEIQGASAYRFIIRQDGRPDLIFNASSPQASL